VTNDDLAVTVTSDRDFTDHETGSVPRLQSLRHSS
jgi:hypothetical protein